MNVFLFLKGELRQSKGVFFGLTVLLALALAVAVSVIQTERMVKSSTIRAADQFDILVGTKGSRSALLLGTVYLRDEMLSLVPMPVLNNLSPKSSDISWAAPLAFGDRAGKASLVGTTRVFVDQAGKRTLLAGRNFEKPYEAVAGSNAGFSINDEFHPGHSRKANACCSRLRRGCTERTSPCGSPAWGPPRPCCWRQRWHRGRRPCGVRPGSRRSKIWRHS